MRTALGLVLLTLLLPVAGAHAGVVSIDGTVLRYTGAGTDNDNISISRETNDIRVRKFGDHALSTTSGQCAQANPADDVVCAGVAGNLSRIVATTGEGADSVGYSNLGIGLPGEADLGPGNDAGFVVDEDMPFSVTVRGGPGRDTLIGGKLGDVLDGGADTDSLRGRLGADVIDGGEGFDEVHYDNEPGRTGGVTVTLDDVADDGSPVGNEGDKVIRAEDIFGTPEADVLVGDANANVIFGYEGNDRITGNGGFDVLYGDGTFGAMPGNDEIFARDGIGERVDCGDGTDTVHSDDIDTVSACETNDSSPDAVLDRDADGVNKPGDCNDSNPAIKPGAFDTPDDGVDQNCDGADATDLDRDNDNFNRPQDCDDNRPSVFPGADEVPGNGRDEDCNGRDAEAPVVGAGVTFDTVPAGSRTRFTRLTVTALQKGDTLRISCAPRRCGVRARTLRAARAGNLNITRRIGRALPAGAKLDIRVSRPNATAIVLRITMRRGRSPSARKLCLRAGATRPAAC